VVVFAKSTRRYIGEHVASGDLLMTRAGRARAPGTVQGRVEPASRAAYRDVIALLVERGAEAIILGCTEIMLLVRLEDSSVLLYDTTTIHAEAAVELALSGL
jgi:Asp/Glu/hydantoin racemase